MFPTLLSIAIADPRSQTAPGFPNLSEMAEAMTRLSRLPSKMAAMPGRVRALPKKAESFYQSAAWRAYRAAHKAWTIARQGGVWCCKCGSTRRLILDHRVERRDGGPDFPLNDEADWYCTGCHNAKTAEAKAKRAEGSR